MHKPAPPPAKRRLAAGEDFCCVPECDNPVVIRAAAVRLPCRDCQAKGHRAAVRVTMTAPLLMAQAGVPKRYSMMSRQSWETAFPAQKWTDVGISNIHGVRYTLEQMARHFGSDQDHWLLMIFGSHGRRKTGLGTAIFREKLDEMNAAGKLRRRALWFDVEGMITRWSAEFESGLWKQQVQEAIDAPLLLLDDFMVVRGNKGSYWKDAVTTLVRSRHADGRPTIITFNGNSLDEIGKAVNHSLPSRLAGRLTFYIKGGQDYRLAQTRLMQPQQSQRGE